VRLVRLNARRGHAPARATAIAAYIGSAYLDCITGSYQWASVAER
jgi:hypothetical protein